MTASSATDRAQHRTDSSSHEAARTQRRLALVIVFGGLALLYGSFQPWDTCTKRPCEGDFGLFSLVSRSGVSIGWGVVTAELGLFLAAAGVIAFRRPRTFAFRLETTAFGLLASTVIVAYFIRTFIVPEFFAYGPKLGLVVAAGGAVLATLASFRMRPGDPASKAWARSCRPALALLLGGVVLWGLAVTGQIGLGVEPVTLALVLIALGAGAWPGRIPGMRATAATTGALIAVSGALALASILFAEFNPDVLAITPFAIVLVLIVINVLDVPVGEPGTRTRTKIDVGIAAVRSRTGWLVTTLVLTAGTVLLLIGRLIAPDSQLIRPFLIERVPSDPAWLVGLVALGLCIVGGTVIALARRSEPS